MTSAFPRSEKRRASGGLRKHPRPGFPQVRRPATEQDSTSEHIVPLFGSAPSRDGWVDLSDLATRPAGRGSVFHPESGSLNSRNRIALSCNAYFSATYRLVLRLLRDW